LKADHPVQILVDLGISKYDHVQVNLNVRNDILYLKIDDFGAGLFPVGKETNQAVVSSKFNTMPTDIIGNVCDFINSQLINEEYSPQGQYAEDRISRGKTTREILDESNFRSRAVEVCHSGIGESVTVEYLENNIPCYGQLVGVSMSEGSLKAIVHSDVSMRDLHLEMIDIKIDKQSLLEVEGKVKLMHAEQEVRRAASSPSSY